MGMERSYLGRRPRPSAFAPGEEASSSSSRRRRTRYFQRSPSYSPTSPSYSPTSPPYSPGPTFSPYSFSGLPRLDDDNEDEDAIGDDVGPDDDNHSQQEEEQRSESDDGIEREVSRGSDADGGDNGDEEEDQEERRSGSHGGNGAEREQQHDDDDDDGDFEIGEEEQSEGEGEGEGERAQRPPQPFDVVQGNVAAGAVEGENAALPPPRPVSCSESSGGVAGEMTVTVERTELDCGICLLPLKPPIFQCDVGHVVCSPCRDKLRPAAASRCHVCRTPTEFRRCHAMEHLVESIRVPCPNAAHGCAFRPAYHGRERHARECCAHAPCHCPGSGDGDGDGCGFIGATAALAEHVVAVHRWPCTAEAAAAPGRSFAVHLRDGFNFVLTAVRGNDDRRYLLLLDMARTAFGRAVSVVWIGSRAAAVAGGPGSSDTTTTACMLELTCSQYNNFPSRSCQSSKFHVACTDPSNGLPDPNDSFQFFVPNYLVRGSDDQAAAVPVAAIISIGSSS